MRPSPGARREEALKQGHDAQVSISRFLEFVREAVGLGLIFAAGLGAVVAVLKWLVGGSAVRDAMIEAVLRGWPMLGFMLGGAVASVRALYRMTSSSAYRCAVGLAVGAAFFLVWTVLAVGAIGDGGPPDLMYAGVLAVGIIGAFIARFQPHGMARVLFATALAQALVAVIALSAGWHRAPGSSVQEIVLFNMFFSALFGGSAWLFRQAAQERSPGGAEVA